MCESKNDSTQSVKDAPLHLYAVLSVSCSERFPFLGGAARANFLPII